MEHAAALRALLRSAGGLIAQAPRRAEAEAEALQGDDAILTWATDANAAFVVFSFRSNARDGPASDHATAAARGEANENLARRLVVIARARGDGR